MWETFNHVKFNYCTVMDDLWWKLLTILNLLVLAVVVQMFSEIKELLQEVRKALPAALRSQESLANDIRAIQLKLDMRDKTNEELAREVEWDLQKERLRQRRIDISGE
jgi:hypothetical protein